MDYFNYLRGELRVEDVSVQEIAEKHGTPVYVYSGRTILEHYRKLLQTKQSEISRNFAKSKAESRSAGDDGTEDYIDYAVNSYAKTPPRTSPTLTRG